MPQLERRQVERSLPRKGFDRENREKHVFFVHRNGDGQKTGIQTFVSRGTDYKSLGPSLVGTMARQCRLTSSQFIELVNCTITGDEYDCLVAEK